MTKRHEHIRVKLPRSEFGEPKHPVKLEHLVSWYGITMAI